MVTFNDKPIVSVRLMTYNHAPFIREAMEGIMKQETSFPVEVVVGDDFSTDGTLDIIREYKDATNIKIKILERKVGDEYWGKRQEKGRLYNFINILENCKGKYIALLDGDDYWIDPKKLQKQVDFLEANEQYNVCFTRANLLKNNEFELHSIPEKEGLIYSFDDLLKHYNFIATASVLIRNTIEEIPEWFIQLPYADLGLYLLVSKHNKIKCLKDVSTVYRIHENGAWSGINAKKKLKTQLSFYQTIYIQLTSAQKQIVKDKKQVTVNKLAAYLSSNRLLRKLKKIQLSCQYKLDS